MSEEKPPCPDCKSNNIHSWGRFRYKCYECGREFQKKYRGKFVQPIKQTYDLNSYNQTDNSRVIEI